MADQKIIEETIFSHALNETLDLIICLPKNYTPLYKYPFCIVQDGKDYLRFGKLLHLANELTDQDKIHKVIFVLLPYKDVQDRRRKYHPDGEQNDAYIHFLAYELLPYLEDRYSSFYLPTSRFLMGDSLGGSTSLKAALKYPHTFGNVILHSPFINDDLLTLFKGIEPARLKLFHIIGSEETEVQTTDGQIANFLDANLLLHKTMIQKNVLHRYYLFAGDHRWKYWQNYIKDSLIYMFPPQLFDLDNAKF
ncbi:esterase family protein [Listeria sp. PSOL-1]|uniref:alpha/beta hydrolase n=1 Tax=Listeria sp. PSOL-1 TaxID=1844999 RepID=UPI0013D6EECC|nr:alpha/beta hydrolase-fold protein [Listeria sp. PSOL-1]